DLEGQPRDGRGIARVRDVFERANHAGVAEAVRGDPRARVSEGRPAAGPYADVRVVVDLVRSRVGGQREHHDGHGKHRDRRARDHLSPPQYSVGCLGPAWGTMRPQVATSFLSPSGALPVRNFPPTNWLKGESGFPSTALLTSSKVCRS